MKCDEIFGNTNISSSDIITFEWLIDQMGALVNRFHEKELKEWIQNACKLFVKWHTILLNIKNYNSCKSLFGIEILDSLECMHTARTKSTVAAF